MNQIKQLSNKHYDTILALNEFAFQYEIPDHRRMHVKQKFENHTIFGTMDGDTIAAKVHIIPFHCYVNKKPLKMGGIASVATLPEYRRQGMVKHLLKHALEHMRDQGQTVSFLYPFSFPFYRKFGWELISMEKHYTVPMERLKQTWDGKGYMRPSEKNIPLLHDIYTRFARHYNGMLTRDEQHWETAVLKESDRIAIAYNDNDEPEGYILYHVKKNILTVNEYAYTSMNGWKLLLEFMANHDSMAKSVKMVVPENDQLTLLLSEPRFEQHLKPLFMARIVDVFEFLKLHTFAETNQSIAAHIYVEDTFLPENNGTYVIRQTGDQTHVTYTKGSEKSASAMHCSVQQLASIMFGFKRPSELYHVGAITGNREAVSTIEQLIPRNQTFLMDFF